MKHITRSSTGALVAAIFAAGCASTPPAENVAAANTAIGNASQTIDRAAADPHVAKYASSELQRANDSLGRAKTAWNDRHDVMTATHEAYLAQQRAATAEQLANARAAEEAVMVAANNRDTAMRVAAAGRAAPATGPGQVEQGLAGFAFGSARLPAQAYPRINDLADTLKSKPGTLVVIEGHTDNVGDVAYNQALAMKRAEAVRAQLLRRGVETSRIVVRSHGEENPVASNDSSAGRRENRRAEVIIAGMSEGTTAMGSSQGSTATTGSGRGQGEQGSQTGQSNQNGQNSQNGQSSQNEQNGQTEQKEQ